MGGNFDLINDLDDASNTLAGSDRDLFLIKNC